MPDMFRELSFLLPRCRHGLHTKNRSKHVCEARQASLPCVKCNSAHIVALLTGKHHCSPQRWRCSQQQVLVEMHTSPGNSQREDPGSLQLTSKSCASGRETPWSSRAAATASSSACCTYMSATSSKRAGASSPVLRSQKRSLQAWDP